MIQILYGEENYLIQKKIKEIKIKENIGPLNISHYDLENISIKEILEDANSTSLFTSQKMLIIENAFIFTSTIPKKAIEQNIELLEKFINNPNDSILIFIVNKEKLDERKKIVKLVKKLNCVFECNKLVNLEKFVKEELNGYEIESKNIQLFLKRVGDNPGIIEQEILKLKTYKDQDLKIKEEDILNLTSKTINTNIFNLIENIILDKKELAIESVREMIKLGQEPIMIIILLANQFRLIYQSKKLYQKGYLPKDIAIYLKVHPYAVQKALEKGKLFTEDILLSYLERLADIDLEIKSGLLDKEIALELFILNK